METLMKLPRELQVLLAATALYVVFSFFDWQQVSAFGITAGNTEWEGIGVIAALLAIALLAWEVVRVVQPELKLGTAESGLVSISLASALLLFTVLTFLTHNEARHWPAWVGLALSIVIEVAAVMRARAEGVHIPTGRPTRPAGPTT
jgi:hypothetical protein